MINLIKIIGPAPSELPLEDLLFKISKEHERVRFSFEAHRNQIETKIKKKSLIKNSKKSFSTKLEETIRIKLIEAGYSGEKLETVLETILSKGAE